MIYHRAANHEGVAKVHAGHRRERIDVITTHPDTRRVVMPDRVQKAVFCRQQAGRHARVEGEGQKGQQICEGQSAANGGECRVGWSNVVVPGDKTMGAVSFCCYRSSVPNWLTRRCLGCVSMHKLG